MKSALLILPILVFSAQPVAARDGRAGVEHAFTRFIAAFNNLDWDTFRRSFAEDVTVFNPDIPEAPSVERLDGRQQVEAGFRSVFDATRQQASGPPYLHIVPTNVRIQMLGEAALVTFEFDRGGGSVGRRTIVFARVGRAWRIVHIHASNATRRG
jgi:ketosteroid isomerase-like protein